MGGMTLTARPEDDQEELSNNSRDVRGKRVEPKVRMTDQTYIGLCGVPDKCFSLLPCFPLYLEQILLVMLLQLLLLLLVLIQLLYSHTVFNLVLE